MSELRGIKVKQGAEGGEGRVFVLQFSEQGQVSDGWG